MLSSEVPKIELGKVSVGDFNETVRVLIVEECCVFTTRALTRLYSCACWSEPSVFAYIKYSFSL